MLSASQVASQLVQPHHYMQQQGMGRNNKNRLCMTEKICIYSGKTRDQSRPIRGTFLKAGIGLWVFYYMYVTHRGGTLSFTEQ